MGIKLWLRNRILYTVLTIKRASSNINNHLAHLSLMCIDNEVNYVSNYHSFALYSVYKALIIGRRHLAQPEFISVITADSI